MNFSKIQIIREFTNDGHTCGVYSAMFKDKQEIFIRNGNSIGAVCHYLGKPASQCVSEVRDNVKEEFLVSLEFDKIKRRDNMDEVFTITRLIQRLQELEDEFGDVEVMLPQSGEEEDENGEPKLQWDAHISEVTDGENEYGETIVQVF
jgi:hypothetical protein